MPEKPHEKKKIEKKEQDSSWEKDQREKSYYYDDACGYENYDPDANDVEDEDEDERIVGTRSDSES